MNIAVGSVKLPRKLVIIFSYGSGSWLTQDMIQNDQTNYPQLVRVFIVDDEKVSRLERLAILCGLKHEKQSPVDRAVAEAYAFLSHSYQPGDNIILIAELPDSHYVIECGEPQLEAAEFLARRLRSSTPSPDALNLQSAYGVMPIQCIAIFTRSPVESVSTFNDHLRSRFPRGIKYTISLTAFDYRPSICSTTSDSEGYIASREISYYEDAFAISTFVHSTKHVIYYHHREDIAEWDEQKPEWTRMLSLHSNEDKGILASEEAQSLGMHQVELRKYRDPKALVWKSYRC